MAQYEQAGGGEHGQFEAKAVLKVLAVSVEILLRRADRQVDVELQSAFTAGQSAVVLLRQVERDQITQLREQLHSFRLA